MSRYKPQGWQRDNYRHYLAAKYGSAGRRYNYTPAYVASDLPLIGADAIGTVGASTVAMLPVAVPAVLAYGTVKFMKGQYDKDKAKPKAKRRYSALFGSKPDLTEEQVEKAIRESRKPHSLESWEQEVGEEEFKRAIAKRDVGEFGRKDLVMGEPSFEKFMRARAAATPSSSEKKVEPEKFIDVSQLNPWRSDIASKGILGPEGEVEEAMEKERTKEYSPQRKEEWEKEWEAYKEAERK